VHAVAHKKGLVTEKKNGKEVIRHTFSLAMLPEFKHSQKIQTRQDCITNVHRTQTFNYFFPRPSLFSGIIHLAG